ncbi:MAG: DNA-processing protein DprA [Pseudomonas sp.]|nr:DNA-processing protein DprA [Pseudomonas sp.]
MHYPLSDSRQAFVVLSLLDGFGARAVTRLLPHFPCLADVLDADLLRLQSLGLKPRAIESVQAWQRGDAALLARFERVQTWLEQSGCSALCLDSPDYPALLREIADPPPLLYLRGDPGLLHDPQLAMVGTRHPGPHGGATARAFARSFTASGLLVTSGMALGIDGACHQGALDAEGQTIAVWGTGLDNCYPRRHKALAAQIVEQGGLLVSELPPDAAAQPGQFPQRNRIISGLSLGTLVVEASLNSGSLITARLALEQNREVFAMPGSIHNTQAKGCHQLLRQGAHLVETVQDVLDVLKLPLKAALAAAEGCDEVTQAPDSRLWRCLDHQPASIDWLSQHSGLAVEQVMYELLDLELAGHVQQTPHGFSRR